MARSARQLLCRIRHRSLPKTETSIATTLMELLAGPGVEKIQPTGDIVWTTEATFAFRAMN